MGSLKCLLSQQNAVYYVRPSEYDGCKHRICEGGESKIDVCRFGYSVFSHLYKPRLASPFFGKNMGKQQHEYENCKIDDYHHGKRQFIERKAAWNDGCSEHYHFDSAYELMFDPKYVTVTDQHARDQRNRRKEGGQKNDPQTRIIANE
jgi:hypothetical protein